MNLGVITSGPGTAGACTSNAPMSARPATTRAKPSPRWSKSLPGKAGSGSGPASVAGLPARSAMVWVGPPLAASAASIGSTPIWVPPASVTTTAGSITPRIEWSDVIAPTGPRSIPLLPARIVPTTLVLPSPTALACTLRSASTPSLPPWSPPTADFATGSTSPERYNPPTNSAVLPVIVDCTTSSAGT